MKVDAIICNVKIELLQKTIRFEINKPAINILDSRPKWKDEEYRQAYMESAVYQTIAWQIKVNREHRNINYRDLAEKIGVSESIILSAEDTESDGHDIALLVKIANAFDCALVVNFVSFSELAYKSNMLRKNDLIACSFSEDNLYGKTKHSLR